MAKHFITGEAKGKATCEAFGLRLFSLMPPRPALPPLQAPQHYFSPGIALLSQEEQRRLRPFAVEWNGLQLQFLTASSTFSKSQFDEGSLLLLQTLSQLGDFPDTSRVCDLGCGWGAVGAFWAKLNPTHTVFALDINPRSVQLARLNFERNEVPNAIAWCGDGLSSAQLDFFDLLAFNPPIRAGNLVIERLFLEAHQSLKPGGELWAVIRTSQGAKTWAKKLGTLFGSCETVEMRGGYRILKAVKC